VGEPSLERVAGEDRAAAAADLRQAGEAGLHPEAAGVGFGACRELEIEAQRMGPRADQRHAALGHVDQLRQLVETGVPQPPAERRHAGVARHHLADVERIRPVAAILPEGAELQHLDRSAVLSEPGLAVERRPRRAQADETRQRQEQRPDDEECRYRQHAVERSLEPQLPGEAAPVGGSLKRYDSRTHD
jgi:hypothetical protein